MSPTCFAVTGTFPPIAEGASAPNGTVEFQAIAEVADGVSIATQLPVLSLVTAGALAATELLYVAGVTYQVTSRMAGAPPAIYAFTPTGSAVDLGEVARLAVTPGTSGPQGPIGPQGLIGLTGPQGSIGPQGSTGTAGTNGTNGATGSTGATGPQGNPVTITSNTGNLVVGGSSSAVTLDEPNTVVRKTTTLAMTLDPMMAPSQTPPTTGRPIFMPVTVEVAGTVGHCWTGYVADAANTAPTLPTGTFIAVYDVVTGAQLGTTADLSSGFTAIQNPVSAAFVTPFAVTKGQQLMVMLLMSYTGAAASAPQMLASRLFGTNMSPLTGVAPRALVNTNGSTFPTAPPASIAPASGGLALQASGSNPAFAIVLQT